MAAPLEIADVQPAAPDRHRPSAATGPLRRWGRRRRAPLLASALLLVVATQYAMFWGDDVQHAGRWDVPGDIWFTLRTSLALVHGHLGAVYSPANHLITFPGILVVLAPVAELVSALHLPMGLPITLVTHPPAWAVVGPYEIAVGCSVLFAADDVARRLGAGAARRAALLAPQVVVLAVVTALWGHPEDPLAVALLLWGALALDDGRLRRGGWLLGGAVAMQPLVLLALPAVAALALGPGRGPALRRLAALAVRVVVPSAVLLAGPLAAGWSTTVRALLQQPNDLLKDHPTPWARLAPPLGHGWVASGPGRMVALGLAVTAGAALVARARAATPSLEAVLWVAAAALALRWAFEPVVDPYYAWPPLALALALAGRRGVGRWRAAAVGLAAAVAAVVGEQHWAQPTAWWLAMLLLQFLAVAVAAPWWRGRPAGGGPVPAGGPVPLPTRRGRGPVPTAARRRACGRPPAPDGC